MSSVSPESQNPEGRTVSGGSQGCAGGGGLVGIRAPLVLLGFGSLYARVTWKGLGGCPFQLGRCLRLFPEWESVLGALNLVSFLFP